MRPTPSRARFALVAVLVAGCGQASVAAPTPPPSMPSPATESAPAATPPPTASPRPTGTTAPTPGPVTGIDEMGATWIPVDAFVDWVVVADGIPWVSRENGAMPLDPETGAPGPVVPIEGSTCTGFGVGYGSIWSATCGNHSLTRIDHAAGTAAKRLELPTTGDVAEEGSVGVGEGGVWVVTTEPSLVKVSKDGRKVLGTWPLPAGAAGARAGLGAVWVTVPQADQLLRIDPKDPTSRTETRVGERPRFLAIGEGAVWTMDAVSQTVTKVNPDGEVVATIDVADQPIRGGDIAVGGGYVWARTWDNLVVRIDPETGTTLRLGPKSGSGGVAADDRAAWITAHDINTIWRLPLR